jgi:TPP-dependent 2-oxoacid decarboxylase
MDVGEYSERVMGPEHVVKVVDEAIKTALTRHGVAHIQIPKDVHEMPASEEHRSAANMVRHSADLYAPDDRIPSQAKLQPATDLINAGSKVAIMAGRGCLKARARSCNWPTEWVARSSNRRSARRSCPMTAPTRPAASACWALPHQGMRSNTATC